MVSSCPQLGTETNKNVITGAVALFCVSLVAFKFLGGEFIPSLEEGDFAVEMSMSQGTSLSQW